LSKDGRHINFTSSELQLLRTFKKCLSLNNKISEKTSSFKSTRKYYQVQFGNVKLYRWLMSIGLMPNKTHRLGKIDVPKKFFRDFLRGHLDGDGSVVTYTDRYMSYKDRRYKYYRVYLTFNSSTPEHIRWIHATIKDSFDTGGSLSSWKDKKRNRKFYLWKLRFAKKDSLKLLPWIYYKADLPCLKRKKKIADAFLRRMQSNKVYSQN